MVRTALDDPSFVENEHPVHLPREFEIVRGDERRKALGLTLAQMAERTNVSLGYLSQIELGKNSASIETLYRISLGLRVRVADLFQAIQPQV